MSPSIAAFAFSTFFFGALVLVALLEHHSHRRPKMLRRDVKRAKIEQRSPSLHGSGLPRW
jgi:hypothetical protein